MYLSRLILNPRNRRVQREIANPYQMHKTLMRCFPAKLDRALEAALGGYTQALVVESWEQAGVAIADLRKRSAGWATFLPLDAVRAPPPNPAPSGKGVLGLAHELIEYESRYDEIARLLLRSYPAVARLDLLWGRVPVHFGDPDGLVCVSVLYH